jgi:energy-coupling factor transport system ATP-binding protein
MNIILNEVSFSYKKNQKNVINYFSYTFKSGKMYIIKGANGSGKTTLSKLICGIEKGYSGEIYFDDKNIKKYSIGKISKNIGYLFQNPTMQLFAETVEEELSFPYKITNKFNQEIEIKIAEILTKFNLNNCKEVHPLLLSDGEKQRLALASIFLRDTDFIILDEPSSSIDSKGKEFLADTINDYVKSGGSAIIITHDEKFQNLLNYNEIIDFDRGLI